MKTIIVLLIYAIIILYVSGIVISFNPFKIHFETPYIAIGTIFLGIAIGFLQYQSKIDGKKEGRKEIIEMIEQLSKHDTI
jgi:hypothetical protein